MNGWSGHALWLGGRGAVGAGREGGVTWQGAMAVRQATMTAGGPRGNMTAALGLPARAEAGARNWEGSGWGGMID